MHISFTYDANGNKPILNSNQIKIQTTPILAIDDSEKIICFDSNTKSTDPHEKSIITQPE